MVDAMETVPTLVQLSLGTIRDAGMRWRVNQMQSKALERLRQERMKRCVTCDRSQRPSNARC